MAQLPDYFPLVPGSRWVYRGTRFQDSLTISLGDPVTINNTTYHRLLGYAPGELLIRRTEDGNFVYWNGLDKVDVPLLRFDGKEFESNATACKQSGQAVDRPSTYKGPVGEFDQARTIRYTPGICADAGLTSEIFVPNLGLVRRTQTSFVGERAVDLVYAQIGGITYLNEAGVSFSISVTRLDSNGVAARLTLNNRTDTELLLRFSSGQIFNFIVRNDKGDAVYNWAADKTFLQQLQTVSVKGEAVWHDAFVLPSLPAGLYSVEGMLVNSDGKKFSATANLSLQ